MIILNKPVALHGNWLVLLLVAESSISLQSKGLTYFTVADTDLRLQFLVVCVLDCNIFLIVALFWHNIDNIATKIYNQDTVNQSLHLKKLNKATCSWHQRIRRLFK